MEISVLILLLLAGVGFAQLLSNSNVMMPFRMWLSGNENWFARGILKLLTAHVCYGLYAGLVVYILYLCSPYLNVVLLALAVSCVAHTFIQQPIFKESSPKETP